jgi:hypothetical protein
MQEINPIKNAISDLGSRGNALKDYLGFEIKNERLIEVLRELEDPDVWKSRSRSSIRKRAWNFRRYCQYN